MVLLISIPFHDYSPSVLLSLQRKKQFLITWQKKITPLEPKYDNCRTGLRSNQRLHSGFQISMSIIL